VQENKLQKMPAIYHQSLWCRCKNCLKNSVWIQTI